MQTLLQLDQPDNWPADLQSYLCKHYDLFLGWETGIGRPDEVAYDRAIYDLADILRRYAIIGWHCTRLTAPEARAIIKSGMQLPDGVMLGRRVDELVKAGQVSAAIALRLKSENQANDQNRKGMIWFCFFPPWLGGEGGIERFFRHWGGEALYNSHEDDATTSPVLGRIGNPCLVEADVPLEVLENRTGLAFKVVHRYLISRGYQTGEPVAHEDRAKTAIPATSIRRIIRFPDPEFCTLTGCSTWCRPLA